MSTRGAVAVYRSQPPTQTQTQTQHLTTTPKALLSAHLSVCRITGIVRIHQICQSERTWDFGVGCPRIQLPHSTFRWGMHM